MQEFDFVVAVDIDNTILYGKGFLYKVVNFALLPSKRKAKQKVFKAKSNSSVLENFITKVLKLNELSVLPEAKEVLTALYNNKLSVVILSSRPNAIKNFTVKQLNSLGIPYTKIICGCKNKSAVCKKLNVDVLIDDNFYHCKNTTKQQTKIMAVNLNKNIKKHFKLPNLFITNSWAKIQNILLDAFKAKFSLMEETFKAKFSSTEDAIVK